MEPKLVALLESSKEPGAEILVLTGAGISAESGIPTFRGHEGYWVIGSRNYMPEEMATLAMFERHPEQVWSWYLMRFGVCRSAEPNLAHRALVALENALRDRFTLVTQNIDGLHRRAGSSETRTHCIHGDAAYVRCASECGVGILPLPPVRVDAKQTGLTAEQRQLLSCPRCGGWLRPHVLWFDECYDEEKYHAESALRAAQRASLLIVIGTSGATSLPMRIGMLCEQLGAAIIDINPEPNPFGAIAQRAKRGHAMRCSACKGVPDIVEYLTNGVF
jgi:NAD-dependent deacetylase